MKTNNEKGIAVRERIKDFIVRYIQKHGYPPTVREIEKAVKLKSTSSVYSHLMRMFKDGMIETDAEPGTPRAIRIPGYRLLPPEESSCSGCYFENFTRKLLPCSNCVREKKDKYIKNPGNMYETMEYAKE